jgi:hypothetical protein
MLVRASLTFVRQTGEFFDTGGVLAAYLAHSVRQSGEIVTYVGSRASHLWETGQ